MDQDVLRMLYLLFLSDAVISLIGAIVVWRKGEGRTALFLSLLLLALFIDGLASVIVLGRQPGQFSTSLIGFRVISRAFKTIAVWLFILYMLGVLSGKKKQLPIAGA